jgi:L-threonylcarbamoyladenylate synthase
VEKATAEAITDAGQLIRGGKLVAFPTETVYGLGCDATNGEAVAAVFAAKGRPGFNPLIIHVTSLGAAKTLVSFDGRARKIAENFWPGALTLVLPRTENCPVSLLAGAGLDTLAIRISTHPDARALIDAADRPIAAPSANRSGSVSPTTAQHVADSLGGNVDLILDGGPCPIGLESTVLDLCSGIPVILRPGGVTEEEIAALIGQVKTMTNSADAPRSPGQTESHYATRAPLRLNTGAARAGEALLAFGPVPPGNSAIVENLSFAGDLKEAATNLFNMMRRLDALAPTGIAVMPVPREGLGAAINDRLRRAAHVAPLARDEPIS